MGHAPGLFGDSAIRFLPGWPGPTGTFHIGRTHLPASFAGNDYHFSATIPMRTSAFSGVGSWHPRCGSSAPPKSAKSVAPSGRCGVIRWCAWWGILSKIRPRWVRRPCCGRKAHLSAQPMPAGPYCCSTPRGDGPRRCERTFPAWSVAVWGASARLIRAVPDWGPIPTAAWRLWKPCMRLAACWACPQTVY